ncbi:hypothetical protein ACFC1T_08825 [Kitasatospora sp. NPDC056076]|uniref:hypothetical protein n=1 Tax=Kitasatospora sp. NPDC056076 TaxID=3345703 RepID=UPI0035DE3CE4
MHAAYPDTAARFANAAAEALTGHRNNYGAETAFCQTIHGRLLIASWNDSEETWSLHLTETQTISIFENVNGVTTPELSTTLRTLYFGLFARIAAHEGFFTPSDLALVRAVSTAHEEYIADLGSAARPAHHTLDTPSTPTSDGYSITTAADNKGIALRLFAASFTRPMLAEYREVPAHALPGAIRLLVQQLNHHRRITAERESFTLDTTIVKVFTDYLATRSRDAGDLTALAARFIGAIAAMTPDPAATFDDARAHTPHLGSDPEPHDIAARRDWLTALGQQLTARADTVNAQLARREQDLTEARGLRDDAFTKDLQQALNHTAARHDTLTQLAEQATKNAIAFDSEHPEDE